MRHFCHGIVHAGCSTEKHLMKSEALQMSKQSESQLFAFSATALTGMLCWHVR